MNNQQLDDRWRTGDSYETFMGRWSRSVAREFVQWLDVDAGLSWLDVGCGTGALTDAICDTANPRLVVACDPSQAFVNHVNRNKADPRVSAVLAGDDCLPETSGGFDCLVSGLVINFFSDPLQSVREMCSRTRSGGVVAGYVWDYADGMQFLRFFWDEAGALDESARMLDEGTRFSICSSAALETLFGDAGLQEVTSGSIEIPTRFASFTDYWQPFLGGTGPAPSYVASLDDDNREALRSRLEHRLSDGPGNRIHLIARAWAVRGSLR